MATNEKFEIRGVHHIALVCADMARTVRFYRDVLGMLLERLGFTFEHEFEEFDAMQSQYRLHRPAAPLH